MSPEPEVIEGHCIYCGSYNYDCRDERSNTWFTATGEYGGTQITAVFVCLDCDHSWVVDEPSDQEMIDAGLYYE